MRTALLAIVAAICMGASAQEKMTSRNGGTTSHVEPLTTEEVYDYEVVADTVTADLEEDLELPITVTNNFNCKSLATRYDILERAQEYHQRGLTFEMMLALRQAWVMGCMEEVDAYIQEHEDVQKALTALLRIEELDTMSKEKLTKLRDDLKMMGDNEMRVLCSLVLLMAEDSNEATGITTVDDVLRRVEPDYMNNPFCVFIKAAEAQEHNDDEECFRLLQICADKGGAMAYTALGEIYFHAHLGAIDHEKAAEHYLKAYNAGVVDDRRVHEFIELTDIYPENVTLQRVRNNLYKIKTIKFPYWAKIQNRLLDR